MGDIEKIFNKNKTSENGSQEIARKQKILEKTKKHFNLRNIVLVTIVLLLVGSFSLTFYFYSQWKKIKTNPEESTKEEAAVIIKKISRYADLPKDEIPTMAVVKDVEKLQDQPFFSKAKNGDIALIYSKSGKAILYRPSEEKIIEMTTLGGSAVTNNSSQTATESNPNPESSGSSTPVDNQQSDNQDEVQAEGVAKEVRPARVVIYNGTNIKGLAQTIAEKISSIPQVQIGTKANAKKNYEVNVVIDLTGENEELTKILAETLEGIVRELPEGEAKPDADILVIGGKI